MSIIEKALSLVHGDRQESYGHPFDDFSRTGRMWGAILGIPDVSPRKVALCLIALKVARESHQHKDDTVIDIAGYAETLALVVERESVTSPVTPPVTPPVTVGVTGLRTSSSNSQSSSSTHPWRACAGDCCVTEGTVTP